MKKSLLLMVLGHITFMTLHAQTAESLFWRRDSLQVSEIGPEMGNQFNKVGHHGPAVENSHMALRIYFNDSGAIDVYSKAGGQMELMEYKWYPSWDVQQNLGVGNDHYIAGKTVGLGGIALWDGQQEVKLVATKGRKARVGKTRKGSFAEVIAYGVEYGSGLVDIMIRVDVDKKHREAYVTATELNGQKVQFLTGVNYHEGQQLFFGKDYMGVWGVHKGDKSPIPVEIGAGLWFKVKDFSAVERTDNMLRIISKPSVSAKTKIISSSVKETELNTPEKFETYIKTK